MRTYHGYMAASSKCHRLPAPNPPDGTAAAALADTWTKPVAGSPLGPTAAVILDRECRSAIRSQRRSWCTTAAGSSDQSTYYPITTVPGCEDVVSVSQREDPTGSFVAVAPVGTGDYWGFPVINVRCSDQVRFHFHDAGQPELAANDFLTFVANRGLAA
jgi:hypothetical protein